MKDINYPSIKSQILLNSFKTIQDISKVLKLLDYLAERNRRYYKVNNKETNRLRNILKQKLLILDPNRDK